MQDEFSNGTGLTCGDGTTCEPGHGQTPNPLTCCAVDSLARTSVTLDGAKGLPASEAVCGLNTRGSFAFYDRDSCSWKTYQRCLDGGLIEFSVAWPRSGTMLNGHVFLRRLPVRRMKGTASGLLPTPRASDAERGGRGDLLTVLRGYQCKHAGTLPTPTARDWKNGKASETTHERNSRPLNEVLSQMSGNQSGQTNPRFVEWMMGFPIGWTELDASETPSFRKLPSGSGVGLSNDSDEEG